MPVFAKFAKGSALYYKGEKVRMVKVDVDKHKEIAAYYQIQSVPTLMIFKDGKQLWRQSGVMRANDLSTILAQYE